MFPTMDVTPIVVTFSATSVSFFFLAQTFYILRRIKISEASRHHEETETKRQNEVLPNPWPYNPGKEEPAKITWSQRPARFLE